MKKKLLIVPIVLLALSALAVGTVAAQEEQPPQTPVVPFTGMGRMGGRFMRGTTPGTGSGLLHDYMETALADALGLTETQVEEAFAAGRSMVQVSLDNGIVAADVPAFLSDVHAAALALAVSDGVLTQEQADWMSQRMAQRGYGVGVAPQDGTGARFGRGGMGSGICPLQTTP